MSHHTDRTPNVIHGLTPARSGDRANTRNLGHMRPQVPFEAHLQSQRARWTADASAVQTHLNDPIGPNPDQFDIAAVRLDSRANQVDHLFDAISKLLIRRDLGHRPW